MVAEGREGHFHSFIDFLTNELLEMKSKNTIEEEEGKSEK
jgi:hypothetical protein